MAAALPVPGLSLHASAQMQRVKFQVTAKGEQQGVVSVAVSRVPRLV